MDFELEPHRLPFVAKSLVCSSSAHHKCDFCYPVNTVAPPYSGHNIRTIGDGGLRSGLGHEDEALRDLRIRSLKKKPRELPLPLLWEVTERRRHL